MWWRNLAHLLIPERVLQYEDTAMARVRHATVRSRQPSFRAVYREPLRVFPPEGQAQTVP